MRLPPCSQVMMKVSILPTTSPPQLGQVAKHLSRTFAPFVAEGGEIGVPLIESPPPLHFQAVPFVANQIDGHTHRQVAAHGRIERHQHTLRGVCQGSVLRKYAVEDRLSVLGFTGLEEGRVGPCFDEVAFGIGPEQPYRLTVDLPTTMNEALKRMLFSSRYPASRFSISRVASETSLTTSNIVRAPIRLVAASPSAQRCLNTLMTAWVPARFPELSRTITRLPRRSNTVILQNLAKLSTPAFVRESEAKIMPLSSITPIQ